MYVCMYVITSIIQLAGWFQSSVLDPCTETRHSVNYGMEWNGMQTYLESKLTKNGARECITSVPDCSSRSWAFLTSWA